MRRRAQAAMEYLMTYGWAILIIIVVIAALYAMGVFTIKGGVPCSPCFSTFAYTDHNSSHIIITSGSREIHGITASGYSFITEISPWTESEQGGYVSSLGNASYPISPGTKIYVKKDTGSIADGEVVTISYIVTESGMSKTDSATLHTV
jgi:hypothetical protein